MKVCFPVENESNNSLGSQVYNHFGSAPRFVVVDSETHEVTEIINRDLGHAHGACSPLRALGGASVDAIVVAGIGAGALQGLMGAGLQVYRSAGGSIADNLAQLKRNELDQWQLSQVCGGHSHGHGCCGH